GGRRIYGLRASVDLGGGTFCIFGPEVHQAPPAGEKLPVLQAQTHEVVRVRGCNVVAWVVIDRDFVDVDAELIGQLLPVAAGKSKASAHGLSIRARPLSPGRFLQPQL